MRILWHNIIAMALLVIAAVLLIKCWPDIGAFLMSMKHIGPGHATEDKTLGLVAFGLVGILLVAIVRILTSHNGK